MYAAEPVVAARLLSPVVMVDVTFTLAAACVDGSGFRFAVQALLYPEARGPARHRVSVGESAGQRNPSFAMQGTAAQRRIFALCAKRLRLTHPTTTIPTDRCR